MRKPLPAKNLHVRTLSKGKISIGEYINGKWTNVVDPFNPKDERALATLQRLMKDFTSRTKREIEWIGKDENARTFIATLTRP